MSRFVVFFEAPQEPSLEEQELMSAKLRGMRIIDRLPGSFLIEADEPRLNVAVGQGDGWRVVPDARLAPMGRRSAVGSVAVSPHCGGAHSKDV